MSIGRVRSHYTCHIATKCKHLASLVISKEKYNDTVKPTYAVKSNIEYTGQFQCFSFVRLLLS